MGPHKRAGWHRRLSNDKTIGMTITFRIRFHTHPGQSLWLVGSHPLPHPMPLRYVNPECWQVTVPLSPRAANEPLRYSYVLAQADGGQTMDWGRDRTLVPAAYGCSELLVFDSWNHAGDVENVFATKPFKKVLFADHFTAPETGTPPQATHTFRAKAPRLKKNQTLCLLGGNAALGHWSTQKPVLMRRSPQTDYFSAALDLRGQSFPLTYKYGVFDVTENSFMHHEAGADRVLDDVDMPGRHTVINDGFARLPLAPWRGAGVAVPVFSLRSESSFGTGEFADLRRLAEWGREAGLKLIQLLPINDTSATGTWKDSYPYAAISAFALHPLYLNLEAVATGRNRELLAAMEPERQRLNALDALDYEGVMKAKLEFLRKIFPSQKAETIGSHEYKRFFTTNEHWLVPYAAFCCLRDRFGSGDFSQWPERREYHAEDVAALVRDNDEAAFYYFIQYHLHRQLTEAVAGVHAAGLVLKGDLAIGVYRHGADAWQSPELYHMNLQAGAPPDAFSAKGQNWGFPTYNWPGMAADGLAWWKQRFVQMANYFDAFRIDHILGFFRIWSNPAHAVEGILGYFDPALPLEPEEFPRHGIHVGRERMLRPFINEAVLEEVFGQQAELVRREFLVPAGAGAYSLKPEFATQRLVADYFACRNMPDAGCGQDAKAAETDEGIKIGLFDLISNVILLEVNGQLHFRFGMEDTWSYKTLPADQQGKLHELYVDYFFRRQDEFWRGEALQKLPALKRVTDMLICGEDLGLVPACVPEVMRDLGLLGLEIQRMPKVMGQEFSRPANAPYLSVVTPATHDMSTIRGWWEEDGEVTQKFFNHELGLPGEAPRTAEPWLVESIVHQHLASGAMWSIFQWQDLVGMDGGLRRDEVAAERINIPAVPNHYWRYRMHLSLERLLQAEGFNAQLRRMIVESGR